MNLPSTTWQEQTIPTPRGHEHLHHAFARPAHASLPAGLPSPRPLAAQAPPAAWATAGHGTRLGLSQGAAPPDLCGFGLPELPVSPLPPPAPTPRAGHTSTRVPRPEFKKVFGTWNVSGTITTPWVCTPRSVHCEDNGIQLTPGPDRMWVNAHSCPEDPTALASQKTESPSPHSVPQPSCFCGDRFLPFSAGTLSVLALT